MRNDLAGFTRGQWRLSIMAIIFAMLAGALIFSTHVYGSGSPFGSRLDFPTGYRPYSVFAADLDGDGDKDLAVANWGSNSVSILKNNGNGTFQTAVNYTVLAAPYSVFAADLDGDNDCDVAAANSHSDKVSILRNNGDGTFQAAVHYTTGDEPVSVFAVDLDADNDRDLAVVNWGSHNVSILKNSGNATFQAPVNYAVGNTPHSVFAADLDRDGDCDLAVANEYSDNVSILKNNGNGTFQSAVNWSAGNQPRSVWAFDLDGDNDYDLAVANELSNNVSILKNNGSAIFQAPVNYPTGNGAWSVCAGDWDGDTYNDLAVTNRYSDNVSILINEDDGTFQTAVNHPTGTSPWSVFGADLDGDTDLDLAVANMWSHSVSVFPNGSQANQAPVAAISISPNPAANYRGNKLVVVYEGYGSAHDMIQFDASLSYDPDGGFITDYVWRFDGNVYSHSQSFQRNDLAPGTYTVSLTAVDDEGQSSTSIKQTLKVIDGLVFRPPFGGDMVLNPKMTFEKVDYWGAQGEVENETFRNGNTGFIGAYSGVHPPWTGCAHSATARAGHYAVFSAPDGHVRATAEILTMGGKSTDILGQAYTKWWFGYIYHDSYPPENWTYPQDPWNWLYSWPTSDQGFFDHWLDWTPLADIFLSYILKLIPGWGWVESLLLEGLQALVDYLDIDEMVVAYLSSGEGTYDRQVLTYTLKITAPYNAVGYFVETKAEAFWTLSSAKAERTALVRYIAIEECDHPAPASLQICGLSPIDLIIVDSHGDTLTKAQTNIAHSKYLEIDIDTDGHIDDYVRIDSAAYGEYLVTVIPDPTADTLKKIYSLLVAYEDALFYLAQDVNVSEIPSLPYRFWTFPLGAISGRVACAGTSLQGVCLDVFDSLGMLSHALIADDSGYYCIDSIPNGNYSVAVVPPLGYRGDTLSREITVYHVPVRADFSLSRVETPAAQRGLGYWKHQVNVLLSGNGNAQEPYEDMCRYMELIRTHFNEHRLNPILIFSVDLAGDCNQRLEALRQVISARTNASMNVKAKAHLGTLLLNMVSGKITQWTVISEDSATVSQAITFCNALIVDSLAENDERAKDIAEMINEGQPLPAGWIDLSTPEIAYRQTAEHEVPLDYSLAQNSPNPFNPSTGISFTLPKAGNIRLEVLNIIGRRVRTLVDEFRIAGPHQVLWDGRDDNGVAVSSGVYLYRIKAGEFTQTKKMVLMK